MDENGKEILVITFADPPGLTGVRMKDGTVYPYLYLGPGDSGYEEDVSERNIITFAIDRVLDVGQVESLLLPDPVRRDVGTQ